MVQEKNTKLNYPQKNVGLAHGSIVHGLGGFAHGF